MSHESQGGLRALLAHPTFVNKELHFKLGSSKIFALLDPADPLARLSGPGPRPQADSLAAFYHLNVLQYSRPQESAVVEADLLSVRATRAGLPDLQLGRDLVIPAGSLDRPATTLTDLWLLDHDSVRQVSLCMSSVREAGPPPQELAGVLASSEYPAVLVAGNLTRAAFLYGIEGYFKLLVEAGRLIERLTRTVALHPRAGTSLHAINAAFRFNPDRYSSLALLTPHEAP